MRVIVHCEVTVMSVTWRHRGTKVPVLVFLAPPQDPMTLVQLTISLLFVSAEKIKSLHYSL